MSLGGDIMEEMYEKEIIPPLKKRLYVAEQLLNEVVAHMEYTEMDTLYSPIHGATGIEEIKLFLKIK